MEGKGGGGIEALATGLGVKTGGGMIDLGTALATGLGVKAGGGMIDFGTATGVTGGEGTSALATGLHEGAAGPRS